MKTVLKTQPGFFAAETNDSGKNPHCPQGKMLIHTIVVETYELDYHNGDLDQIKFAVLGAIPSLLADEGEKDKSELLKKVLLQLGIAIESNKENFT